MIFSKINSKLNLKFSLQVAFAMSLAIFLASILKLKYAAAAGIVTLATIQTTKKETLLVALKRLIGYIAMLLMSIVIFKVFGFNIISYGIFVFIFAVLNYYFGSMEVLSSNAVMATHFLDAKSTSLQMIQNENQIFLIGVGIGILVNLLMPVFSKDFDQIKKKIDTMLSDFYGIIYLRVRGIYLVTAQVDDKELAYQNDKKELDIIKAFIKESIEKLKEHEDNIIFPEESYLLEYFEMRRNQLAIMEDIWHDSRSLHVTIEEALIVSEFIREIEDQYDETNTVDSLLKRSEELMDFFTNKELPKTRQEFEERAKLFRIMNDIINILRIKREFVNGLSKEVIDKYWS